MEDSTRTSDVELEVTLRSIHYRAPDAPFIVGTFESKQHPEPFIATGDLLAPSIGDSYTLTGSWVTHPKYGRQFRFSSFSIIYPATREGIEKYLSSGLIRGVGRVMAARIVKAFGEATIDVLNTDMDRLCEVPGIGAKKLERIRESWEEQRGVQKVMLFLKSHHVGTAYAVRIFKTYGQAAVEVVTENPYRLVDDIDGIGFATADQIALKVGMDINDERRLTAGIQHVLREAARGGGHVCMPESGVIESAQGKLGADETAVQHALRIAIDRAAVVREGERLFLPQLYHAEISIAESLSRLYRAERPRIDPQDLFASIRAVEKKHSIEFSPLQIEAIQHSVAEPVTIVTGGPGTGKSTAVIGILALAEELQWRVAMCAPTGRAARRLGEVTHHEAKTIHRLLEFDPFGGFFRKSEDDPIDAELVIVDEVSMVDSPLMAFLLRAVPSESRIVFVGDSDQLPSVGPGNVLHDMIASGQIPRVTLTTIFRQARESAIITNSHRILQGLAPMFHTDCFFITVEAAEDIPRIIEEIVAERLPREMGFHALRDIQVLTPMHRTAAGVAYLNMVLQQALNGKGEVFFRRGDHAYRVGDKVMQTRNNYEKDVFNGDIGFIVSANTEETTCSILFDQRQVEYSFDELEDVALAYCITIHKSQGSEYKAVIIPMTMQHRIMLQRNLVYTGMTRAQKLLVFVGQKNALHVAVRNDRIARRYTSLRDRLVEMLK